MWQTWWISRSAVPSVICWIACDFFSSYHFWVPAVYSKVGPRRPETTALMFKVCFVLLWRIVKFLPSAFVWCFRWAPCPASQPDPVSMTSTWTRSQRRSLGSSEHAVQGNPQRYYHAYINIKYVISYVSFLSHWVRLQSEATLSLSLPHAHCWTHGPVFFSQAACCVLRVLRSMRAPSDSSFPCAFGQEMLSYSSQQLKPSPHQHHRNMSG